MTADSAPQRRQNDASTVSFGDFRLDRATRQLFKEDQPVELSVRGFDLICLLQDNVDRAVSRQELLDELWGDRVVTDNTLSQLVSSVRRALGDGADEAKYIRTVHGFGLQWVGEIKSLPTPEVSRKSVSDSAPPGLKWLQIGFAVLLLGLVVAGMSFLAGRSSQPPPDAADNPRPIREPGQVVLALLPFATDPDAETRLLSLSITDYLTARLGSLPGISVLDPDELGRFLSEPTVANVRDTIDPDFILEARLDNADKPERAKLVARIVPRGGPPTALAARDLALPDIPNDFAYFYNARQALVEELAAIISPGSALPPLGQSQPQDPEALKIALSADRILRSTLCDHQGLDLQLQSAISRAPDSAYLWWLLGNHYFTRVWGCGEPVALLQQAFSAAEQADALAPGRYQATAQLRHTFLLETGQAEEAYAYSLDGDLSKADSLYRVALSLRYAGFVAEAANYRERLLELDPLYFFQGRYGRAPNSLLYAGRHKEFLKTIPASGPYHSYYHGFVNLLEGNVSAAHDNLAQAFGDFPSDMFGSLSRALAAHIDGDNRLAVEMVRQVAEGRDRLPLRDGEVTYKQAQLLALAGDVDGSLAALEQSFQQGFFCALCFADDQALASVRVDQRFAPLLDRVRRRHVEFAERFGLDPELQD